MSSDAAAIEAFIASKGVTRTVVTYWRVYRSETRGVVYHRCTKDGEPVCRCGKTALEAGSLGDVEEHTRAPLYACQWANYRQKGRVWGR